MSIFSDISHSSASRPARRFGRDQRRAALALLSVLVVGCGDEGAPASGSRGAGTGGGATAAGGAGSQAGHGAGSATGPGGSATTAGNGGKAGGGATSGSSGTATNGGSGGATSGGAGPGGMGGTGAGGMAGASAGSANAGGSMAGGQSGGGASAGGAGSGGNAGRAQGGSSSGGKGGASGTCGGLNLHPFGCKFAWGIADPGGSSYSAYSYLDFMSYWVDAGISASGTYQTCDGCNWLGKLAGTSLVPVYVAYVIGFLGHANGIVDGNQDGAKKLTTDGAQLIRDHRQAIVDAYGWYATKTHAAWPDKPLVWMLEGDFVQYADAAQKNALSFAELAALAGDITCAIKGNMPNAVVAIDQSSWNSDDVTNGFWGALDAAGVNYDMVWTTGVGNNKGYIQSDTNDTSYNHATATYKYLHELTGRTIMVDTSAGISAAGDSWSIATAGDLNARIAEGVIAPDITGTPPGNLQSNLSALRPKLDALPSCP